MWLSICLLVALLVLCYVYLRWHFDVWQKLGIPSLEPKLIFGNFPSIITGKRHMSHDHNEIYSKYKRRYAVLGTFMGRTPQLFVMDPKVAAQVMVTKFSKFRNNIGSERISYRSSDKIVSRHPFSIKDQEEWKLKRSEMVAALTPSKLEKAYPIWQSSARKLREFLRQKCMATNGSVTLNTRDLTHRFTVDVIADFLWGLESDTFVQTHGPHNMIMAMVAKMLEQMFHNAAWAFKLYAAPILRIFCRQRVFPAETDEFFSRLTKDAIALRLQDSEKRHRCDLLNYVIELQEKKHISHDDAVGHLMTALADGYETAGTVLLHVLYYLARYPVIQEKLRQEIMGELSNDGFLSFEQLNSLPYLDQCVHETLRIITPVPVYFRVCNETTTLEIDGGNDCLTIPAGTLIALPVFCYHHDADYFPQPYTFNPERFDNNLHHELTKQGIFMPFGNGPRMCLGMRMGLLEVKTAVVELLQKYRLKCTANTVAEKQPDSNTFILGLEGDLSLEYERL